MFYLYFMLPSYRSLSIFFLSKQYPVLSIYFILNPILNHTGYLFLFHNHVKPTHLVSAALLSVLLPNIPIFQFPLSHYLSKAKSCFQLSFFLSFFLSFLVSALSLDYFEWTKHLISHVTTIEKLIQTNIDKKESVQ